MGHHVINCNWGSSYATAADVALMAVGAEVFALATTTTFTPTFSVDDSNLVFNHTITTMELIVQRLDALNTRYMSSSLSLIGMLSLGGDGYLNSTILCLSMREDMRSRGWISSGLQMIF